MIVLLRKLIHSTVCSPSLSFYYYTPETHSWSLCLCQRLFASLQGAVLQPDWESAKLLPLLLTSGDVSNLNRHNLHSSKSSPAVCLTLHVVIRGFFFSTEVCNITKSGGLSQAPFSNSPLWECCKSKLSSTSHSLFTWESVTSINKMPC